MLWCCCLSCYSSESGDLPTEKTVLMAASVSHFSCVTNLLLWRGVKEKVNFSFSFYKSCINLLQADDRCSEDPISSG